MTTEDFLEMQYKFHNKFLREWAERSGTTCLLYDIYICLKSGFGYMGEIRMDMDFILALDESDKSLLIKRNAFLFR